MVSCLHSSRRGMKRAMMEVVAGGAVTTPLDVNRYVRATLLAATQDFKVSVNAWTWTRLQAALGRVLWTGSVPPAGVTACAEKMAGSRDQHQPVLWQPCPLLSCICALKTPSATAWSLLTLCWSA